MNTKYDRILGCLREADGDGAGTSAGMKIDRASNLSPVYAAPGRYTIIDCTTWQRAFVINLVPCLDDDEAGEYCIEFSTDDTRVPTVYFGAQEEIAWPVALDLQPGRRYQISIMQGIALWTSVEKGK